jgi:hypothetical protein
MPERRLADPQVDAIPAGKYPKLANCSAYPLRQSCNYGDNAVAYWNRCEHMKYARDKDDGFRGQWYCALIHAAGPV